MKRKQKTGLKLVVVKPTKKEKEYKVYITEAGYLLFENGKNSFETNGHSKENIEVSEESPMSKKDKLIGKAMAVWGIADKENEILTEQLPFYFRRDYAQSACQQMNKSITEKRKPYKVKKAFLLYPN